MSKKTSKGSSNSSFPRKRESSNSLIQQWIPAFAGMTREVAGMTGKGNAYTSPSATLHDTTIVIPGLVPGIQGETRHACDARHGWCVSQASRLPPWIAGKGRQ